jgi:hypothetical protein
MAICNTLTRNLVEVCSAQSQFGGAKQRMWILEDYQNLSTTFDAGSDFLIATITVGSGVKWRALEGELNFNSGVTEAVAADGVATVHNHKVIFAVKLGASTKLLAAQQLDDLDTIAQFRNCVIVVETTNGDFLMYGFDRGLKVTGLAGGTGTQLVDSTAYTLTFEGQQLTMPRLVDRTYAQMNALTV